MVNVFVKIQSGDCTTEYRNGKEGKNDHRGG
jgi:hypothetical protein